MQDELLMEIRIRCDEPVSVKGTEKQIVMIPFTGETSGPYFSGHVVGTGVDTQTIGKDGKAFLSARYMLEGDDAAGSPCRIFIENQGSWDTGFAPKVVTDSPLLAGWEKAELSADVEVIPEGVMIRILRKVSERNFIQ